MKTAEYVKGLGFEEQKLFAKKIQVWLGHYSQKVIDNVFLKMDEIVNNPFALKLIDELYERTQVEIAEETRNIEWMLTSDSFASIHNHPLEHSSSYRDVLYDMFIK